MKYTKDQPQAYRPIKQNVESGIYAYCTCGWSSNQPFCDGSHTGKGLEPMLVEITEKRKISWCSCKETKKAPFCDGTHKTMPGYEPALPA
ncbi:MAG: CDGSH iron-sulfur domain-containing protein [Bacteroidota bacterium]|nr:CDGSH iron-sulfur domain-containing protein [Bacteroidota bacterium]